ncbi:uncharacterized protein LOC127265852 [Andrographis paniculata]|uniref:uncharacterized protein LOC127265852 n=1 Tax=Andrographis paniculata TaxID=175694 RepID=UPI0021E6E2BB|nr:uncharacterized protein LOC127265852 [Andrographis paniculata]
MEMEPSFKFKGLPPHKRFSLARKHQQNQNQNSLPASAIADVALPKASSTSCLPAKKRKRVMEEEVDEDPFHPNPNPISSLCLPAKKRIWALHPLELDLNLQPPQIQHNEIDEEEEVEVEEDDGIVCAVCGSTDGDPTDPIVLCDGCDLMVHSTCYGTPLTQGIPQGDWFCAKCKCTSEQQQQGTCCLCPNSGGALKKTTSSEWAHLVCAVYVPEVYFGDWEGREGIDCSQVVGRRWKGRCCVCGVRNVGCLVDCSEPNCGLRFHVTCGIREGLCLQYTQAKRKKKTAGGGVVAAFCASHTHLWNKQEQTGKFKIVAREEKEN